MGARLTQTRSMQLTDKAKALFRERRKNNADVLVTDILWLASAEFGRQRSEGFRFRGTSFERDGLTHFIGNGKSRVWTTEQD